MVVLLDENHYFTGNYAEIGGIQGGIEVKALPDTKDLLKQRAYKYEKNAWVLDEARYRELTIKQ